VVSEDFPIAAVTLRQMVPPGPFPAGVPTLTTFPVAPSAMPGTQDSRERVMVFAPHPDDETLGCAGALRRAVGSGDKVRVVVATCGDAYRSAKNLFETTFPALSYDRDGDGDFDMIDYGIIRHLETIAAMLALGIEPSNVLFLGYPDAGVDNLWTSPEIYQSPFTGASAVPQSYQFAYRVDAPYSRGSFLSDIKSVIREFSPTIIYTTTDTDTHQDHWALAKFVRQALLELSPVRSWKAHYGYLIHWEANEPGWPHDSAEWSFPGGHAPPNVDITLADFGYSRAEKRDVIDLYSSQTLAGARYLQNFAKESEIFWLEGWARSVADELP
jgi:LmbE family N-acetylglucosaminyl deacetylase